MGRRSRATDDSEARGGDGAAADASARLPWGMGSEEMQPSSLAALTDDKLARFVLGQQKKTKFEKVQLSIRSTLLIVLLLQD